MLLDGAGVSRLQTGPACEVCGAPAKGRSSACSAKCEGILSRYPRDAILADARHLGVRRTLGKHAAGSAARRYAEKIVYQATMNGQL